MTMAKRPDQSNAEMLLRSFCRSVATATAVLALGAFLVLGFLGLLYLLMVRPWWAIGLAVFAGIFAMTIQNFLARKDGMYP